MHTFDWKSLAAGLFFGLVLACAMGAAQQAQPEVGRYQIISSGDQQAYVIDTVTGRVWSRSNGRFSSEKN